MDNYENYREKYLKSELTEDNAMVSPIKMFQNWMVGAINDHVIEPNAFILSTVDSDGMPEARTLLLKEIFEEGFVFYTNYESNKAKQIDENPKVSALFLWLNSQRQVRISGIAEKVSEEKSTEYFKKRPRGSQVGAWTSPQSSIIPNREFLDQKRKDVVNNHLGKDHLDKPPFWGGYRIVPTKIEFWQGRDNRLHDRLLYTRNVEGDWTIDRLAP